VLEFRKHFFVEAITNGSMTKGLVFQKYFEFFIKHLPDDQVYPVYLFMMGALPE